MRQKIAELLTVILFFLVVISIVMANEPGWSEKKTVLVAVDGLTLLVVIVVDQTWKRIAILKQKFHGRTQR